MRGENREYYMTYRFKPDLFTLLITIAVFLILVTTVVMTMIHDTNSSYWVIAIIAVIVALTLPHCFVSISIGKGFVKINKVYGSVFIDNIEDISIINKKEVTMSLRKFGNGGFMGFWGHYYSHKLGNFRVWAINLNQLVLIKTKDGKKYVTNYPYGLLGKQ